MTVRQRQATLEDSPQVAEVLLSSRKTFLPYACSAQSDSEVSQWVRESLIPSGNVTVACIGSSVVGVLATAREPTGSWVNQLYLAPDYVGQRIGAQLLTHALATLPRPVRLYTFQANSRARAFYERYGFKAVAFTDGSANDEHCPDVLYEYGGTVDDGA
ncbi:GNAT family N-acetyltransferase [Caenimonas terrae]|uniref:GNAT family N-acetyltransferase n=1 Tax=Caenimonas terrae TaxID=696074 RepID=A0ABW0NKU9_9BURK